MVITTIIALYLTRVVLLHLGANDFGIYSLIGGIIALLAFVNTALSVSTQRFLSVALGEKDNIKLKSIFSSSILIHIIMSLALLILLEICSLFLFDGFLNISPERIGAAKAVYQIMIASTLITVVGVPYNAVINAREDMWLFSIVETVCAVLKLGIIVLFQVIHSDALILYTFWILIVTFINFVIKYLWCRIKYYECKCDFNNVKSNTSLIRNLLGFTGWNAFGTLALVGRNQGVAIVLNLFWGTAINAVYGIANQVNSQLIYFSTMMTTSMTPQIMKSYGEGNYERMLSLSVFTCKLSFYMSAVFAIPLILELRFILEAWLKDVPQFTETFCSLIVYMFLIMQLTPGLNRSIQARGKIKSYQVVTSIVLLIPLPIGFMLGYFKIGSNSMILIAMIISQIIQYFVTVYYARVLVGLKVKKFFEFTLKSIVIYACVYYVFLYGTKNLSLISSDIVTFCIIVPTSMLVFTIFYYFTVFDKHDKRKVENVIKTILKKH